MPSQWKRTNPAAGLPRSIVRSTVPLASVILTNTWPPPSGTLTAPSMPPAASVPASAGTTTSRPIIPLACRIWLPCSDLPRSSNEACNACVAETWLICASWLTICDESIGLVGSWLRICCTSKLRKSAWPRVFSLPRLAAFAALAALPIAMSLMRGSSWRTEGDSCAGASLAQVQGLLQQLARRVHHLDVVLVGARSGNHVDQLVDRIDVARIDVAAGIGQRVARFVAAGNRRLALGDAEHLHAVAGRVRIAGALLVADSREQRLARAVGGFGRTGHAVGIGQVAGHRVEAGRLRGHAGAGHAEDGEHRHQPWPPLIAIRNMRICAVMNDRLAW